MRTLHPASMEAKEALQAYDYDKYLASGGKPFNHEFSSEFKDTKDFIGWFHGKEWSGSKKPK